jgi:hypothetical protein
MILEKLLKEELFVCTVLLTKYYSDNQINKNDWGHVACMGERRNKYRVLVGKPEGKRPLGKPRCNGKILK